MSSCCFSFLSVVTTKQYNLHFMSHSDSQGPDRSARVLRYIVNSSVAAKHALPSTVDQWLACSCVQCRCIASFLCQTSHHLGQGLGHEATASAARAQRLLRLDALDRLFSRFPGTS